MTQLLSRFSSKLGDFDTDPVAIDLIGTGINANKAIVLLVEGRTQATTGAQLTAITLDGVAGELFYNPAAAGHGGFAIAYWNEAQHPGTGTFDVLMTFDANLDSGNCLTLFELEDAPQTTAGFIHAFSNPVASVVPDAPYDFSTTLNGANGEFVIPYLAIADNSYWDPLLTDLSPNMTNIDFQDATRAMLYTWYGIGSGASEVFSGTYDHNRATHSPESFHLGVLAVMEEVVPPNNDPTLDTPEPDFSISSDQSGVVGTVSGNFSDADSDPITHSIVSDAPAGITMAANGDISANGSVAPGTYTITYQGDDLQGGTPAQDTFVLTVTAPVFRIDSVSAGPYLEDPLITLNHSNANAAGKTYAILGQATTEESQDANQSVLRLPADLKAFGDQTLLYDDDLTIEVNDGGEVDSVTIQISPQAGHQFQTIAALTGFWAHPAMNGVQVGWRAHGYLLSGTGEFDLSNGAIPEGAVARVTVYDTAWGSSGDITADAPVVADTTPDQFDLGADVSAAEPGAVIQRTFVIAGIDGGETVTVVATGSASVSPSSAQLGDTVTVELTAGAFDAVVSGGASINGVSDAFSVTSRAQIVPVVTNQPLNQSVSAGQLVAFSAAFTNAASVQWYDASDDSALMGETSTTLQFTAQQADNGDSFYCVATSSDGATTQTNTATLTVSAQVPTVVPTITPVGGVSLSLDEGDPYSDPAWTAADDVGAVAVVWSGDTVDTNTPGVYTRTANASNAVGDAVPVNYTVTVSAAGENLPSITAPTNTTLSLTVPYEIDSILSSHSEIVAWMSLWSAVDFEENPIDLVFSIPGILKVNESPYAFDVNAVDSDGRVRTTGASIELSRLSATGAPALIQPGEIHRYGQKGNRFFVIDYFDACRHKCMPL